MLDEYFKRDDVLQFMDELRHNERYFLKEKDRFDKYTICISNELALYIFYDALFLYKVIVDDIYLFDEYLEQMDKLYKKLDRFDNILEGVHKLIGKMVSIHLNIKDVETPKARRKILSYIYDRYIVNGYFIHGFNTSYSDSILSDGFVPDQYLNYYDEFEKLSSIFSKYNAVSIIDKDFSNHQISFTDDFVMGCYYSHYAPMYFSSFLENEDYFGKRNRKDGYLIDNYSLSTYSLKKFMSSNMFGEDDRNFVSTLVKKEWDLLHRTDKKISLLLVKRSIIPHTKVKLQEYLDDDRGIYDVIDRLISSDYPHVSSKKVLSVDDFEVVNLDSYYIQEEENTSEVLSAEEEYYQYKEKEVNEEFLNVYGKVSIFLLIGSLLILLGVLITIFMVVKGM